MKTRLLNKHPSNLVATLVEIFAHIIQCTWNPRCYSLALQGTAWTGLALLGATVEGDPVWKGANPMKMSETLPSGDSWCLPQQELPPSAISDRACLWK